MAFILNTGGAPALEGPSGFDEEVDRLYFDLESEDRDTRRTPHGRKKSSGLFDKNLWLATTFICSA